MVHGTPVLVAKLGFDLKNSVLGSHLCQSPIWIFVAVGRCRLRSVGTDSYFRLKLPSLLLKIYPGGRWSAIESVMKSQGLDICWMLK